MSTAALAHHSSPSKGQPTVARIDATALPRWPFALPFVSYPLCWALGLGDLIWPISGVIMLAILVRARNTRLPRGLGIWLLFLFWVVCSAIQLDSAGRILGSAYRFALYAAATVIGIYAFNAVRNLTVRYMTGVMTYFLGIMTVGGYLGVFTPLMTIRTPLAHVIPQGLQANELIGEMVVRRVTQWNPDAWILLDPRPSAPFLYTNTWGNVYSLVLPLALVYLAKVWREPARRAITLMVIAASIVPAVLTLNRGMFVGLGTVLAYIAFRALLHGHVLQVATGALTVGVLTVIWLISPAGERLLSRVEVSSSTEDRYDLYLETIRRTLESPLLGFGAPRPSELPWMPSVGTQGQLWTVLFSHGFIGLGLFLGWFVYVLVVSFRRAGWVVIVAGGLTLATLVETTYYGMMTGLNVSMLAAALILRTDPEGVGEEPVEAEVGDDTG